MPDRKFTVQTLITGKNVAKKAFRDANTSLDTMRDKMAGINRVGRQMSQIGGQMRRVGRNAAIVAGGMTAPLALGVKRLATFETELGKVGVLYQATATEAVKNHGQAVRDISKQTATATSEINKSLFDYISATGDVAGANKFIEATAKASSGAYSNMSSVVEGTIGILNAYGMGANEALKVTDQLTIANEVGRLTYERLSASIGDVTANAQRFGVSSGEMLSSISSVTRLTGDVEGAVVGLNALLQQIANPMDDTVKRFGKLNENLKENEKVLLGVDAIQKSGGFLKWFDRFMEATGGSAHAIQSLVGGQRRASRFFGSLVVQQKTFVDTTARMEKATNAGTLSLENFAKRMKTIEFRVGQIRQRFNDLILTVGENVLPVFEEYEGKIRGVIIQTSEWLKANRKLFPDMIKRYVNLIKWVAGAGGAVWALGLLVQVAGNVAKAIRGVTLALNLLTANPIVLGLTAIVASLALIVNSVRKIKQDPKGASRALGKTVRQFTDPFIGKRPTGTTAEAQEMIKKATQKKPATEASANNFGFGMISMDAKGNVKVNQKAVQKAKDANQKVADNTTRTFKKMQRKLTDIFKDGIKARKNEGVEPINIFEGRRGKTFTTDELMKFKDGFMKEAIGGMVSQNKAPNPSRNVNVDNVNINNVQDPETILDEIERATIATGVAIG